jgi:HSP20 family protein
MGNFIYFKVLIVITFFQIAVDAAISNSKETTIITTNKVDDSLSRSDFQNFINRYKNIQKKRGKLFDDFFNDDFFNNQMNPFEEMERMRKEMQEHFKDFDNSFPQEFNNWFTDRFGGGNTTDIEVREDDKFVYYEIEVDGFNKEGLKIDIENNTVTLSGEIEVVNETTREDGGISRSKSLSKFHRSFPAPKGVDTYKAKIEIKDKKVVIKFPKDKNLKNSGKDMI